MIKLMSPSELLPTISLTAIILLLFLALPPTSSAEQIEDISEIEQQVKKVDEEPSKTAPGETPSAWKSLFGSNGVDTETSTVQEPAANTALNPSVTAEPAAVTAGKSAGESVAAEKIDQDHPETVNDVQNLIAPEKTAAENMANSQGSVPSTSIPGAIQNTAETPSSTMWQDFLAMLGLRDNRQSIPPLVVKNKPLDLGQDYIIGPGDLLNISVWRDDALSRSVVVLPDGKIQFPLIGELLAGGKSVKQLKQEVVEKLTSYVVDADITVEVKQSNSLFVYIIGRVNSPGRQMLVAETTILQALAMAGGPNPFAEIEDIKVFRQEKDRTLVYSFRYSQVVSGHNLDDNLLLKRGDVIVVP